MDIYSLSLSASPKTAVIIILVAFAAGLLSGLGIYFGVIRKK